MGFFKDLGTLKAQAREIERHHDVGAQMADGMARMQAANAMMAQQTAATMMGTHASANGIDATAAVSAIRQTGMQLNLAIVLDIDLVVLRGGIPMPVTVRQAVEQIHLARARVGEQLRVKVDPHNPSMVWIDWTRRD